MRPISHACEAWCIHSVALGSQEIFNPFPALNSVPRAVNQHKECRDAHARRRALAHQLRPKLKRQEPHVVWFPCGVSDRCLLPG
jgi:hypothetical protein